VPAVVAESAASGETSRTSGIARRIDSESSFDQDGGLWRAPHPSPPGNPRSQRLMLRSVRADTTEMASKHVAQGLVVTLHEFVDEFLHDKDASAEVHEEIPRRPVRRPYGPRASGTTGLFHMHYW